jgi:phosphoribosyl-ATP pyrophosphohydrolase/phosphoribosyl-AMP cyclohydrolase
VKGRIATGRSAAGIEAGQAPQATPGSLPITSSGSATVAAPAEGSSRWPEPDFSRGLLPAVVQDAATGQVRMLGYLNEEGYRRTRETGLLVFWSRSRERLWQKGETSGNVLRVQRVLVDCDGDALLVLVDPEGPTCHTGGESCFGDAPAAPLTQTPSASPAQASTPASADTPVTAVTVLADLERVIAERDRDRPVNSYTTSLLEAGTPAAGRKVAEEALEAAFAASFEGAERLSEEAADLLYHLLVLLRSGGVTLADVARCLERRRR